MEFLIADIFFGALGWTFLFLKYRDTEKVVTARDSDFDGSFATAGRSIAFTTFLILSGFLILGLLTAMAFGLTRN